MDPITEIKKVFIISSYKIKDKGHIEVISQTLKKEGYEPHPWYTELRTGAIVLDEVKKAIQDNDFVIVYFSRDRQYVDDGEHKFKFGAAPNVILEYGMSLIAMDLSRIRIIEDGSDLEIPSDVHGILRNNILGSDAEKLTEQIKTIAREWRSIPSKKDLYGVTEPIIKYRSELNRILSQITNYNSSPIKDLKVDDSLLVSLYTHALDKVISRFWTTTYIKSGFWKTGHGKVLLANEKMVDRFAKNFNAELSIADDTPPLRRIYLIPKPINEFLKDVGREIDGLNAQDKREGDLEWHVNLKSAYRRFEKISFCEMRYLYVGSTFDNYYSGDLLKKDDTEIAIYDDFRVDYFGGAKDGHISSLRMYTPALKEQFEEKLHFLESYHQELWDKAKPINVLLDKLQKKVNYHFKKIDYSVPKLIRFDRNFDAADKRVKRLEYNTTIDFLEYNNLFLIIKDYLDIGTCTCRYPLKLNTEFKNRNLKKPSILGIDVDPDCIQFSKLNIEAAKDADNIEVKEIDFLDESSDLNRSNKKYQLITCMLGTVSHFGWDKNLKHEDDLQNALRNIDRLLDKNGVAIISNWLLSGSKQMLSIYEPDEVEQLKSFTEPSFVLEDRLKKVFNYVEKKEVGNFLHLFFCSKKRYKMPN